MTELEEIQAIEESLTSFTKRLDENMNQRFCELRKCSFFDPIPGDWLQLISEQSDIRSFSDGDCITTEGDQMNTFYVILFGTTTVYVNHKIVGTISSGDCIGEGTFFADKNLLRSATVVANGQVITAEIPKIGIDHLLSNPQFSAYMNKALLLALFKKLQGANRKIQMLMQDESGQA